MKDAGGHDWEEFRRLMPVSRRWAYFDHAAVAPLSGPAQEAVAAWARESAEEGDTVWPRWAERVEEIRAAAAGLFGADREEIAFVPNTTAGITLVAEGLDWRDGDNVVVPADEFPSNLYPWMNLASRGVETRRVATEEPLIDLDRLLAACDGRTRLIAASWVGYASGWQIDVEELVSRAHRRGILVFLDAIQGLGVFPLAAGACGVDFFAADGHKWLLGPEGAGVFYVRREHLDRLRPLGVGWHSVAHAQDFTHIELRLKPSAERFEGGSQNMAGVLALGASLDLLSRFGLAADSSAVGDRVVTVTDLLCDRLAAAGARLACRREVGRKSGIVTFDVAGRDPQEVRRRLMAQGVVLNCRGGHLRASPHAYNDEADIERLIAGLA